jgi:hypothetical protein
MVLAGSSTFSASAFPYAVVAVDNRPIFVVSMEKGSIVIKLLLLMDKDGIAVASIRDNNFWVKTGYHVDHDAHSLSFFGSDDGPIFKVDLFSSCAIALEGDFKFSGEELVISQKFITTSPEPSIFMSGYWGNSSICMWHGRGLPCHIDPSTALAKDWR